MRHGTIVPVGLALLLLTLAIVWPASSQATPPETVLVNARVHTVDDRFSTVEAVAIADGQFTAVGSNTDIRRLAGPTTRVIDLAGRTVVPGLQDNHLHDAGGGPGVDLSRARSLQEVLALIEARVRDASAGQVVVTNADWHEAQLREQRLPYRKDLDRIAPDTPVVVVRGGHEYILNSAALSKWNITRATPEPVGGRIARDAAGELTGELVDRARALVTLPLSSGRLDAAYFVSQHQKLSAAGLTSIRYPGASAEQYRVLQEMRANGQLAVRVNQLMRAADAIDVPKMQAAVKSWGVRQDEGDEWLRIGGIKMGVDGGFEGGWMTELYETPYDEDRTFYGVNTLAPGPYTAIVRMLNQQGWRISTHAVGDAAIDEVLSAYEAASAERSIVGRRWTIEHGFVPRHDQFPRMKALGLAISAQNHLYLAGPRLVRLWGQKRAEWVTPVRAYLDAGLPVSGGTDSSVVPYPPLWVFYHFVSRDTISGGILGAEQRISRQEALRLLTINNAYLTFEERTKGSIEVGKFADLVVLPEDLMTVPLERVESMTVLMTMVGGKVVYQHPSFRPQEIDAR